MTTSFLKLLVEVSGIGLTGEGKSIDATEDLVSVTLVFSFFTADLNAELVVLRTRRHKATVSAAPKRSARLGAINPIVVSYL